MPAWSGSLARLPRRPPASTDSVAQLGRLAALSQRPARENGLVPPAFMERLVTTSFRLSMAGASDFPDPARRMVTFRQRRFSAVIGKSAVSVSLVK